MKIITAHLHGVHFLHDITQPKMLQHIFCASRQSGCAFALKNGNAFCSDSVSQPIAQFCCSKKLHLTTKINTQCYQTVPNADANILPSGEIVLVFFLCLFLARFGIPVNSRSLFHSGCLLSVFVRVVQFSRNVIIFNLQIVQVFNTYENETRNGKYAKTFYC